MSEARIDRLLAAALHQAIADLLPMRLEFYESYLRPRAWREDAVNLAPVTAVLSFLRHEEGEPYDAVMTRAASYAAAWWVAGQPWHVRSGRRLLPLWMRLRQVGALAKRHFESSYRGTKVRVHVRRGRLEIDIRGSIFCSSREQARAAHCGYYLAFVQALLAEDAFAHPGTLAACRALGSTSCIVAIAVPEARA